MAQNYIYPCDNHTVTSGFRTASRPNHNGTDFANVAGAGNVYAFADGVVSAQYRYDGNCYNWGSGNIRMGNALFIQHKHLGLRSDYQHMACFAEGIKPGVSVKKGQIIGTLGNTGASAGAHLHFGLHNGKDYINPIAYLGKANETNNNTSTGDDEMKIGIYGKTDEPARSSALVEGAIALMQPDGNLAVYRRRIAREVDDNSLSKIYEDLRYNEMSSGEIIAVTEH